MHKQTHNYTIMERGGSPSGTENWFWSKDTARKMITQLENEMVVLER